MGGHDPYSSSKGAAELAVASWRRSYPTGPRLATGRAGNVIGGGDWSQDRIVTDFIRAIQSGRALQLRNPRSTRPWQHVLEPLCGYLTLAERLCGNDGAAFAQAWNFGPADSNVVPVETLARLLVAAWGAGEVLDASHPQQPHEAGLLKLDSSLAQARLGWRGRWDVAETARRTAHWYRDLANGADACDLVERDLSAYVSSES